VYSSSTSATALVAKLVQLRGCSCSYGKISGMVIRNFNEEGPFADVVQSTLLKKWERSDDELL